MCSRQGGRERVNGSLQAVEGNGGNRSGNYAAVARYFASFRAARISANSPSFRRWFSIGGSASVLGAGVTERADGTDERENVIHR